MSVFRGGRHEANATQIKISRRTIKTFNHINDNVKKRKPLVNERRQEYDMNVMTGLGRIECVRVEAPLRLPEKSAAFRMGGRDNRRV